MTWHRIPMFYIEISVFPNAMFFLYMRADTQCLKDPIEAFADRFMSQDFTHTNVNDMWIESKTFFLKAMDKFFPSKMTKGKLG